MSLVSTQILRNYTIERIHYCEKGYLLVWGQLVPEDNASSQEWEQKRGPKCQLWWRMVMILVILVPWYAGNSWSSINTHDNDTWVLLDIHHPSPIIDCNHEWEGVRSKEQQRKCGSGRNTTSTTSCGRSKKYGPAALWQQSAIAWAAGGRWCTNKRSLHKKFVSPRQACHGQEQECTSTRWQCHVTCRWHVADRER